LPPASSFSSFDREDDDMFLRNVELTPNYVYGVITQKTVFSKLISVNTNRSENWKDIRTRMLLKSAVTRSVNVTIIFDIALCIEAS
jgi:hypothetical protein